MTEHEVWNPITCPAIVISLSAPNDPVIVKVSPSETVAENPDIEMAADAGYVAVNGPYALESCWWLLTPWPAVYRKVSEDGLFLLFLSQMVHPAGGGGGGTGEKQLFPKALVRGVTASGQQP